MFRWGMRWVLRSARESTDGTRSGCFGGRDLWSAVRTPRLGPFDDRETGTPRGPSSPQDPIDPKSSIRPHLYRSMSFYSPSSSYPFERGRKITLVRVMLSRHSRVPRSVYEKRATTKKGSIGRLREKRAFVTFTNALALKRVSLFALRRIPSPSEFLETALSVGTGPFVSVLDRRGTFEKVASISSTFFSKNRSLPSTRYFIFSNFPSKHETRGIFF